MSADAKNIHLNETVLAALQAEASARSKSADELAAELVAEGLKANRTRRFQALLEKGHALGAKSGITEEQVPEVVKQWRAENRQRSR